VKLNVIYFPQLGYHITVPIDPVTRQPLYEGDPNDPAGGGQWERMFTTENQIYFKDARMRAMDERLGDMWNLICGERNDASLSITVQSLTVQAELEIEISYDLAQRVL
jgi:DNA mismatch repair protein MSH5